MTDSQTPGLLVLHGQRNTGSGSSELWRIKMDHRATWLGNMRGCHKQRKRRRIPGPVFQKGAKMEQKANWQVASTTNWTLISLTRPSCSPGDRASVSGNTFFGVLLFQKASSLSPPICPSLHQPGLSLDNEHPLPPLYRWQWNQGDQQLRSFHLC